MNSRLLRWLKKDVRGPIRNPPRSPFLEFTVKALKIFLCLLVSGFVLWRTLLAFEVHSRFARIRNAGLPTSGAELNAWRNAVPDTENGALLLNEAFLLIRTLPDNRSNEVVELKLLERANEWEPSTRASVAEYAQLNELALAKVREALELSASRFPADFSFGPDTPLPHLARLKEMARILQLRSCLAADEGRGPASAEDISTLVRLARTLDDEPIAISFLVRCAIVQMAVKATERNLNRTGFGEDASAALQRAFAESPNSNLLARAFIGERATMAPAFRLSRSEAEAITRDDDDARNPRPPQRYSGKAGIFNWATGFFERDLNFYLQTMGKSISLAALQPPAALALTNHFDQATTRASKRLYILSAMSLPSFTKIAVRDATIQANAKLAVVALAIERFRIARGKLPETLEELVPRFLDRVPHDPFDGKPLRYRQLPTRYVIYSVGSDGNDDGGREPPARRKSSDKTSYDLTFIVER